MAFFAFNHIKTTAWTLSDVRKLEKMVKRLILLCSLGEKSECRTSFNDKTTVKDNISSENNNVKSVARKCDKIILLKRRNGVPSVSESGGAEERKCSAIS